MDPYLESPKRWRNVHERLIPSWSDDLNTALPREYVATIDERLYVVPEDRNIYQDVSVIRLFETAVQRGGAAVAEVPDPYVHVASLLDDVPGQAFINVVTADSDQRVVTVIELLSPVNKRPGEGRAQYRLKQHEVLHSPANLVEIDLLRAGEHSVAVDEKSLRRACPQWDYLVSLHRTGRESEFDVWAWTVRNRMPRIAIPLEPGVPDVVLDLQPALDRIYDAGRLAQQIDYTRDPEPPFTGEDAAWLDALLREKGLRQ
jgi:hypothetical protein